MSDPKASVRENLKDHWTTTREFLKPTVTKEVIADLRGRFGKEVRPPQMPIKYRWPGERGGISSLVMSVPVAIGDKFEKWWQEQARISRRWMK